MKCNLFHDIKRLKVSEPECGHIGERFIGHNLAIDKVLSLVAECPAKPPNGYTDWYVLVRKKNGGGWEALGCVENCTEDEEAIQLLEEKWDLILPIPKPEGAPEWDGF